MRRDEGTAEEERTDTEITLSCKRIIPVGF
jgi:hypothetical protein